MAVLRQFHGLYATVSRQVVRGRITMLWKKLEYALILAMIWKQEPVDLFDCRTRSWYIEAASSPKDIIILVDRSGSMMGMRREVARHVMVNILDTLGNNDYINIYTFSNTTEPLVPCFENRLVQVTTRILPIKGQEHVGTLS